MTIVRPVVLCCAIAVGASALVACDDNDQKNADSSEPAFATADEDGDDSGDSDDRESDREARDSDREEDSDDVWDVFGDVIDDADAWALESQDEYFTPLGGISYFFTDVDADGVDDLLLRREGRDFAPVTVILNDDGEPRVADGYLINGAAGAGGSRAYMYASHDGYGIYQINAHSIQKDMWSHDQYEVIDGALESVDNVPIGYDERLSDYKTIEWLDTETDEFSGLGTPTQNGEVDGAAPGLEDPDSDSYADDAPADGVQVTGQIAIMTAQEVVDNTPGINGTPNNEPLDREYIVIYFDTPQTITGSKAEQEVTQTVTYGFIGDEGSEWEDFVGQHVTLTYDPSKMRYPSDTSMPLGALRMDQGILDIR